MRSYCQTGTNKIPNFHIFQAVLINSTGGYGGLWYRCLRWICHRCRRGDGGRSCWSSYATFSSCLHCLLLQVMGNDTAPVSTPKKSSFSGEPSISIIPFSHLPAPQHTPHSTTHLPAQFCTGTHTCRIKNGGELDTHVRQRVWWFSHCSSMTEMIHTTQRRHRGKGDFRLRTWQWGTEG